MTVQMSSYLDLNPMFPPVVVLMIMFLCGLFFTRPSGSYYIRLLTDYWTILPIIIVIIFENLAVKWAREASR